MAKNYSEEIKVEAVRRVVLEGETIKSVNEEYGFEAGTLNVWVEQYKEEQPNEDLSDEQKIKNLVKEVEELRKENEFLKKASDFFAVQSNEELDI